MIYVPSDLRKQANEGAASFRDRWRATTWSVSAEVGFLYSHLGICCKNFELFIPDA